MNADFLSKATGCGGQNCVPGWRHDKRPREERYYGHDALGSNRTVTDERGRVVGVQSFDPWGVPDPGKHAGNEQGITLLTELFGFTGERQDAWITHAEGMIFDVTTTSDSAEYEH